jgi:hypothetical protein
MYEKEDLGIILPLRSEIRKLLTRTQWKEIRYLTKRYNMGKIGRIYERIIPKIREKFAIDMNGPPVTIEYTSELYIIEGFVFYNSYQFKIYRWYHWIPDNLDNEKVSEALELEFERHRINKIIKRIKKSEKNE